MGSSISNIWRSGSSPSTIRTGSCSSGSTGTPWTKSPGRSRRWRAERETALEGARRELREETGVEAAEWHPLAELTLSNSVTDERATLFLATRLNHGDASPEPTESLTVRWLPFTEALAMVLDGRITDALSVVGIERVALARLADPAPPRSEPVVSRSRPEPVSG
ncbi:MAG: NUDIX hydrolase [Candidatus Limnocylindrales bacterium]